MSGSEIFGHLHDGSAVYRVHIHAGHLSAAVLSWGAIVQDLRFVGHAAPLVLGFEQFDYYLKYSPSFGIIAGRFANRIRDGRFTLDGKSYQLDTNFLNRHHLHGGSTGFGKQLWQITEQGSDFVTLQLISPDSDMGYPGTLTAACTYRIIPPAILRVELTSQTDQTTLCNLAHHSYFNLSGAADMLDHEVMIKASHYTPVDDELIPTSEVRDVTGSEFDFRQARVMPHGNYDHNFCLSDTVQELREVAQEVAQVRAPATGIVLTVSTTEPGLQFYAGAKLAPPVPGLEGRSYGANAGFCLEAQRWPDAPNHSHFPSAVLRPGEIYQQITDYRFSR